VSEDPLYEATLESKTYFQGKILNLRVDTVRMPSGRTATREIAEHSNSVCVVPLDDEGNVIMVRQYRKPTEGVLLEVPAGGVEDGEVTEETVQRELQEEIGYTAGKLQHLSSFWLAPGWCTEFMHAYLATGLTPATLECDDDENIVVERIPLSRALDLIAAGQIQDVKSIAALLLVERTVRDN
jgi:ADP-ribose pyrophosphatase